MRSSPVSGPGSPGSPLEDPSPPLACACGRHSLSKNNTKPRNKRDDKFPFKKKKNNNNKNKARRSSPLERRPHLLRQSLSCPRDTTVKVGVNACGGAGCLVTSTDCGSGKVNIVATSDLPWTLTTWSLCSRGTPLPADSAAQEGPNGKPVVRGKSASFF